MIKKVYKHEQVFNADFQRVESHTQSCKIYFCGVKVFSVYDKSNETIINYQNSQIGFKNGN